MLFIILLWTFLNDSRPTNDGFLAVYRVHARLGRVIVLAYRYRLGFIRKIRAGAPLRQTAPLAPSAACAAAGVGLIYEQIFFRVLIALPAGEWPEEIYVTRSNALASSLQHVQYIKRTERLRA